MVNINKNITLNGTSEINGVPVVYMSATIETDGNSANINKNIQNQDLYNSNKVEVRKDMSAFEEEVYRVEDELVKEAAIQASKLEKRGK